MKRSGLWLLPCAFFAVCCILNLIGCFISPELKSMVKPALMPLLCLTSVTWLGGRFVPGASVHPATGSDARKGVLPLEGAGLLVAAQLFGFAGDTLLIPDGFLPFVGGMVMFIVGHICYITLFGGRSWKGLKPWHWVLAGVLVPGCAVTLVAVIGVNGSMLVPMLVYAMVLMVLNFSTLAGALRFGGLTWWLLLAGSVLFAFSDSLIAIGAFGQLSPFMRGFGVMSTYLAAQSLLAIGALRLITADKKK